MKQECVIADTVIIDALFEDRVNYLRSVLMHLQHLQIKKCIVFLDPDTGLEPAGRADLKHVLSSEVSAIWSAIKSKDFLAFYQHQTKHHKANNSK